MNFHDSYEHRPESDAEINDKPTLTERVGYIDAKTKIEQLITAGIALKQARADQFDTDQDIDDPDDLADPTRDTGFDLADASVINATIEANMKRRVEAQKNEKSASNTSISTSTQDLALDSDKKNIIKQEVNHE